MSNNIKSLGNGKYRLPQDILVFLGEGDLVITRIPAHLGSDEWITMIYGESRWLEVYEMLEGLPNRDPYMAKVQRIAIGYSELLEVAGDVIDIPSRYGAFFDFNCDHTVSFGNRCVVF